MFSRRPSGGADFILLFTSGNLFDNDRPAGCGGGGSGVVDGRWRTNSRDEREREDRRTRTTFDTIRTKKRVDALSTLVSSSFLLLNFHVFRLYSDRFSLLFSASPPPLACEFRLSRFRNVDVRIARTRSLDRRRQRYSREPRTKRGFPSRSSIRRINMEIPKRLTNERIASTQNLGGTLGTAALSSTTEARGWREDRRVALASPRPNDLPLFIASLWPPPPTCQKRKARSFAFLLRVASFDRTFTRRFFEYSAGFYGRTFRPEIEVGRPWRWLRAAATAGPY